MTSFTYDIIDPCDLIGFPANWGLLRNSKNVYPPTYPTHIHLPPIGTVPRLKNYIVTVSENTWKNSKLNILFLLFDI